MLISARRNKLHLAESEVRYMDKELWKAIVELLEIVKRDNERIAEIRRELAELVTISDQDIAF